MNITVGELKERLKVADDCARVVIKQEGNAFPLFDIECVSPVSEFVISIPKSQVDEDMEAEIKIQNRKLTEATDKAGEIRRLAEELEDIIQ